MVKHLLLYKLCNNDQLKDAHESSLGIDIDGIVISSIGQADDVALISNDLQSLQGLLDLSLSYCSKYHVTLSSEKTKLQVYSAKSSIGDTYHIGK